MKRRHIQHFLSAALMVGMVTGCAQIDNHEWVMKVNEENIPTGIFIMSEMRAYMEAQAMAETDDVLTETIEDKTGEQWISDATVENVKEYYFVDEEFIERGLNISESEKEYLSELAEEQWGIVGAYYNNNGVSSEYYKDYLTHLYKKQLIFNDIYLTDDMITRSRNEITEYLAANLSRVEAFAVSTVRSDETPLTEEEYRKVLEIAQEAVDMMNDGEKTAVTADKVLKECSEILDFDFVDGQGEEYISEFFMNISSVSYDEDFKKYVFSLDENKSGVFEEGEYIYIVHKLPVAKTEEDYKELEKQVMFMLKSSEFMQYIHDEISRYDVTVNEQVISSYSPSKIVLTLK